MMITRRVALGALAAAPLARPALLRAQTSSAPVKIGLLSDVAGPYAHVGGTGSRVTTEMAVADFGGSVLGRPIEVMQADDQNKGDIAGALAREWIDDKGVDLLADGAATSAGLAIQQVARDKKRVFVMSTFDRHRLHRQAVLTLRFPVRCGYLRVGKRCWWCPGQGRR